MNIISWANDGVKKIDNIYDIKLVVAMGFTLALVAVKLFPVLMGLSLRWYIGLFILMALRPLYLFFARR